MHVRLQLLEPLFVLDAEMLLLVDDQQSEVLELHRLAKQRMGADDDVRRSIRDRLLGLRKLLAADEARRLPHLHRQAGETLTESLVMLAGKQSRWHDDSHLEPFHGRDEGRAQCNFSLSETHVAADEPVHGAA